MGMTYLPVPSDSGVSVMGWLSANEAAKGRFWVLLLTGDSEINGRCHC